MNTYIGPKYEKVKLKVGPIGLDASSARRHSFANFVHGIVIVNLFVILKAKKT